MLKKTSILPMFDNGVTPDCELSPPSGDVGRDTLATAGARSTCVVPRIRFHKLLKSDPRFNLVSTGPVPVSVVSESLDGISDTSCSASICCLRCSSSCFSAASRSACCCLRIRSTIQVRKTYQYDPSQRLEEQLPLYPRRRRDRRSVERNVMKRSESLFFGVSNNIRQRDVATLHTYSAI